MSVTWCHSQMAVPFKERYKANVKGDMTIIANSILNRIDKKSAPNDPYNDQSIDAITNDEIDMEYIDIDTDKETFSSSSAALFHKNEASKKIVYAGLYWSATYKYESGYKKGEDKFVAFDKTREPFEEVLVKFPTQKDYTTIKGQLIFDGLQDKKFKDASPYAVYADITEQVKALENPFGFYTVANIRATQGTLIGGSAAGWTMVFVYEDNSMSEKFICSYDGFAGASSESVDIVFRNFVSMPQGDVIVKLASSALEGDFKVDGDLMMFASSTNPSFSNIKTLTRRYSNFFDSSITIEDEHFAYRIPDSKNTLGYDALLTTLRNPNNKIIGNNAKEATLKFKSSGDVFYLFFAALTIEIKAPKTPEEPDNTKVVFEDNKFKLIDKTTNKEIISEAKSTLSENKKTDESVANTEPKVKPDSDSIAEAKTQQNSTKRTDTIEFSSTEKVISEVKNTEPVSKSNSNLIVENKEKATGLSPAIENNPKTAITKVEPKVVASTDLKPKETPVEIPKGAPQKEIEILNNIDSPKGYYLVVNVFNERLNAARFMMSLRNKGFNPNYFINPVNNYMYVYLSFVKSQQEADLLIQSKFDNKYNEEMWILVVNMAE